MEKWFKDNWLRLVAIVFVLGALWPYFPYAYYQLMDWMVAGAGVVTALQSRDRGQTFVAWLFVLVAVVFNPVAPLYLRADIWQIADIAVAVLFAAALFLVKSKDSR